jgi:hypothetical protein
MNTQPQDTSAEEPDGGNPHIRFRGGPRLGDRPGLLNRWQPKNPHLLLQVRTRTLNGTLREKFQSWWPAMAPDAAPTLS